MPINIQLNNGHVASFPDGTPQDKINKILDEDFPITGEDVAVEIAKDPEYKPKLEHYKLYEDWLHNNSKSLLEQAGDFGSRMVNAAPNFVIGVGRGVLNFLNPLSYNYSEGENPVSTLGESTAQGTRNLYGVIAESTNPDSPLFKFKDWILGDGTVETRRKQFLEARDFAVHSAKIEAGEESVLTPSEHLKYNKEVARDLSMLTDPTLLLPVLKPLAATGKLGAMGLKVAGSLERVSELAQATALKPVQAGLEAVGAAGGKVASGIESVAGKVADIAKDANIPDATKGIAAVGAGALAHGLAAKAAAAYGISKAAQVAGELGVAAIDELGNPSRLGVMERLAADQSLSNAARTTANALSYVEPAVALGASIAKGAAEGAAIGGTIGYLNTGTAEGAGEGAGAGLAAGSLGTLAAKGASRLSKTDAFRRAAIAEDVHREIPNIQESDRVNAAQMFGRLMDSGRHDAAAELIDVKNFLGNTVPVRFVNDVQARAVVESKGKAYVPSEGFTMADSQGRPTIWINTDNVKAGAGFHETLHGLLRSNLGEEFSTRMADWAESNLPKDRIEKYVNDYIARIKDSNLRESVRKSMSLDTPEGRRVALEEVSADEFSRFLSSREHRDFLLRGRRDMGGAFIGLAKSVLASATDRLGLTSVRMDRGFESIAKDLIKARNGMKPTIEMSVPKPSKGRTLSPIEIERLNQVVDQTPNLTTPNIQGPAEALSPAQKWRLENERFDSSPITKFINEVVESQADIAKKEIGGVSPAIPFDPPDKTPEGLAQWAKENGKSEFLKRDEKGNVIGLKTEDEYEAGRDLRRKANNKKKDELVKAGVKKSKTGEVVIHDKTLDEVKAGLSGEEQSTIEAMQSAVRNGTAISVDSYLPQLKKKDNSQTSIVAARGMKHEMIAPYEFGINKDGDVYVTGLDLNMIENRATHFLSKDNFKHLKEWQGDLGAALHDAERYAMNLGSRNPLPSEELLGSSKKRDILYKIFGGVMTQDAIAEGVTFKNEPSLGENTYSERAAKSSSTIGTPGEGNSTTPYKSLRIDRIGKATDTGKKIGWNIEGYEKHKINWKPSADGGSSQIYDGSNGMRIIHSTKWRLYAQSGSLIGIYESEERAKKKADSTWQKNAPKSK